MIDYSLLETQGFVVIPGYLDSDELEACRQDYELIGKNRFVNGNYKFLITTNIRHVTDKIQNTLAEVCKKTSLRVDSISPGASYYDTNLVKFRWHQDFDPHHLQQDSYHALNFWMPIIKDVPTESGLTIVQFNKFPEDMSKGLIGIGAKEFFCTEGQTEIHDHNDGHTRTINMSIEDIAVSPVLNAGDLLLMRQDIIHRSQPGETHRVALGVRCYNGEAVLSREWLDEGCVKKREIIKNNPLMFKRVDRAFDISDGPVKLKQVLAAMSKK
jgi:hypothetical protein